MYISKWHNKTINIFPQTIKQSYDPFQNHAINILEQKVKLKFQKKKKEIFFQHHAYPLKIIFSKYLSTDWQINETTLCLRSFISLFTLLYLLIKNIRFLLLRKMRRKMCIYKCMFNVYKNQKSRQTGSRNLTGPKTLPTIWGTYMNLVTKYQISAINSCWEKCDEKCAYMFNVYKTQLSRQTGSRNLTGLKTLPTIWYTYMTLVTKYQISAINSYWEKCDKNILDGQEGEV
jgi:hypothetical protein